MMSVRSTTDMIRHLVFTAHKVRHASTTSLTRQKPAEPEHGQLIFVYHHLQTNQVVYSLTKSMKNNAALRQLPFNGKKTVPRALRKDLWTPLATISFPPRHASQGLLAFRKLRELRRLHETLWDPAEMVALGRRERGRRIMDQKANSVADISVVLGEFGAWGEGKEKGEGEEEGKTAVAVVEKVKKEKEVPVEVRWRDLLNAEFAEVWSNNVIHDVLDGRGVESVYREAAAEAEVVRAAEKKKMAVEKVRNAEVSEKRKTKKLAELEYARVKAEEKAL